MQFVNQYTWNGVTDNNPYGRLNVNFATYKLINDGSTSYDWYFYLAYPGASGINIQSEPGRAIYGSDYRTAHHGEVFNIVSGALAGYGPTNTDGSSASSTAAGVSVSAGTDIGVGVLYEASHSYTIPWLKVDDYSSFYYNRAGWVHDFNEQEQKGSSMNAHNVMPAFVVRTSQNSAALVDAQFDSYWGKPGLLWWDYQGYFYSSVKYPDSYYYTYPQ